MTDLNRFEIAQNGFYNSALEELKNGKKIGHWMWYVFPQIEGLGASPMATTYAIKNKEEAIAYLNHKILGTRLIEITTELNTIKDKSANIIFGRTDSLKLKSCMTLFESITPDNVIFTEILQKFFDGEKCEHTINMLKYYDDSAKDNCIPENIRNKNITHPIKFKFDLNNPYSNLNEFRLAAGKAKSLNKEVEFYKLNMEYYLYHFIECWDWKCYTRMYNKVIQPYLDDVDVLKKVLQSDVIILKNSRNSEYVIHMIPYVQREDPNENIKIYKQLYDWLTKVENEKVKTFVENLWHGADPIRVNPK